MIKTYLFSAAGTKENVPLDDWRSQVKDDNALLWVDVRSVTEAEINGLADKFGLHKLPIESCLDTYRRPHLYEFQDHFYVNMTTVSKTNGKSHAMKPSELNLFVGHNYLITVVTEEKSDAVDLALKDYLTNPALGDRGSTHAIYLLAEDLVETYFPIVEQLDEEADRLEDVMLNKADKQSLKKLFKLKRECFNIRRLLGPQRDIFNELARRDFSFIQNENSIYFQDVYNRMIRIFDMMDTIREILSGNLDIYLSTVSNRLNEVMKALTVAATILMTLSFITGFYGMNFTHIPGLRSPYAFHLVVAAMVVIILGMLWRFKKKGWL
ncbi:MAG: magnesium/cobalt transporter CorA [Armatimonadetes bacterium]|nr:magnesium/cobalt transporter CorA [Armatimonadota bacterium]